MSALVHVAAQDGVAVVTLRREEKLNAISTEMERQLLAALERPEVAAARAVVLTGGARAFSAGADVTEFRDRDPAAILDYYRATGDVYERVADLRAPTIAAIAGYCLGGGLELALAADLRVAERSATLGFPEVAIGIVPSSGGLLRLVRAVGPARAKALVLLGERFSAEEALGHGLLTEVVDDGAALGRARELARALAALPPLAVGVAKQAIDQLPGASREAALLIERLAYGLLAQTRDADEAAAAFTERRQPRFEGR